MLSQLHGLADCCLRPRLEDGPRLEKAVLERGIVILGVLPAADSSSLRGYSESVEI